MDHRSDDGSVNTTYTNQSTQQGGNAKHELSIIEELDLKFGSAKNKHQILHALDHSSILHRIPLPTPNTTTEQARKDFRRERVLLNDVPFIPDKTDVDRCNAFSMTLNVLLERMMRRRELFDAELYPDVEAISDAIMQRACRTGAGADSFFMVQKLLCVEGTFVTQRTFLTDPPIKIDVFVADPASAAESSNSSSSARKMVTCRTGYSMESAGATVLSRAQRSASGVTETAAAERDTPAVPSSSGSRHSTPPSTPPHTRNKALTQEKYTNKSVRASPLKASLRNLGLMSKTSTGSGRPFPAVPETGGASDSPLPSPPQPPVGQGLGSSSSGVAFSPPSSPTASAVTAAAGLGAVQNSNNSQSTSNIEASAARESSSFQSPASSSTVDAAHIELTQPCGAICARIQVMNSFAIYDVSAIEEITGVEGQDPDPWLQVEAIVVDETNFRTDQHWRKLQLIATCPASGKVYTSTPDAHSASRVSGRLSGRMVLRELKSWFTPLVPFSANNTNSNNHNLSGNSLLPQHGSARHTGKSTQHPVPALSSPPATTAATAAGSSAPASTAASMSVGLPTSLTASSVGASHSWDGKSSSSSTQSGNVFAVSLGTNSPCLSVQVESGLSDSGDRFSSGSHTAVVNPHIQLRDAALTALMSPSPATSPRACDDPTVSVLMQLGARGLDDSALCTDSFSSCSGSLPGTDAATDTGTDRGGSVLGDEASIGTADYNTETEGWGGRLSASSGGRSVVSGLPVRTIEELDLLMSSANMDEPGQFGSSAGLQSGSDDEAPAYVSCNKGRVGSRKKVS